jgi:hypothetical protein
MWDFAPGTTITVVCGELPPDERSPYADRGNLNYTSMCRYADLDAVFELYGHLRGTCPGVEVRVRSCHEIDTHAMSEHLILVGGVAWNHSTAWFSELLDVPIRQLLERGDIFVVARGQEVEHFAPTLTTDTLTCHGTDIGVLVHTRNPYNPRRTVTICNGTCSRGVLGVVRAFCDPAVAGANDAYCERFGDDDVCLVMRIAVRDSEPASPRLADEGVVLHEQVIARLAHR